MASLLHWLHTHDTALDLATVWALAVGFGVLAAIKLASWWALRQTQDRTRVGRALKRQKAAEVVILAVLAILYGLSLDAYYEHERFGFWFRLGVRALLIAAIVLAVVFGVRFVLALRRTIETPFPPDPANEPRTGLP